MKGGSAPQPPDPWETAQAQTGMNRETAITQAGLNMMNQVTPQGTLSYRQVGTWPDGTPRFEASQVLSPDQQALYDQGVQTQGELGRIGYEQTQRIGNLLGTPVNLNNEATEARLMELGRARLDPMWDQRQASLETSLANKGIGVGSDAYSAAMRDFNQGRNDSYNNLLLSGRGQAVSETLAERNQPINEITALLNGGQVSQPSFNSPTPNTPVAGVDYAGLVNQNYQAQVANWQAQQAQRQAMLGGLFGLGSAALGGWAYGR